MPFSLLIALFLAFGTDSPANLGPISRSELAPRLRETLLGVSLVASVAGALGRWVAFRTSRRGKPSLGLRRLHAWGARGLEGLTLAVYGWMIHDVGWPWVVHSGWGFRGAILIDDVLILLPFLLMQLAGWWGLYPAERALRIRGDVGLGRHLALKARGSLGMVLPVVLLFAAGQDLAHRLCPKAAESLWALPVGLIVMGGLVLVLSPIFVRLAWPTHPLPPGPLRHRLERLARRFGFRCTDILVWDTGHGVVNAGVTGALPWFRYVLLSDALVDCLDDHQIAAVFGHEIGHIAHRHLLYFGFFFLGSLGVMALVFWAIDVSPLAGSSTALRDDPAVTMLLQAGTTLATVGLYFLVVFGFVSRQFERQADVFGCRAVSCGREGCPPHLDPNGASGDVPATAALCPVGIRIFANALANVATLNGMEHGRRSWRHGSIARRIAFLEGLDGKPDAERRFQRGVSRLRLVLALGLIAAVLVAWTNDSFPHLR